MEIKLIKKELLNNDILFDMYCDNNEDNYEDLFEVDSLQIDCHELPFFPIYINESVESKRRDQYVVACTTIEKYYLDLGMDTLIDRQFWLSLLLTTMKKDIKQAYPTAIENIKQFKNIVTKKFDWENYIYKCIFAAKFASQKYSNRESREDFYRLISDNMDIYNYMLKYELFRNPSFVTNVLEIVNESGLSTKLKARVYGERFPGKDERLGRQIMLELNKMYPTLCVPMLSKSELEEECKKLYFMLEQYTNKNLEKDSEGEVKAA